MMRYGVESRGVQSKVDTNEQREGKKANNGAKKKQNNGLNRMQSSCKKSQNTNARNEHQKKGDGKQKHHETNCFT